MSPFFITETATGLRMYFDYHERLVELVKRIPGRYWCKEERAWIAPKSSRWYVDTAAEWAVSKGICSAVKRDREDDDCVGQLEPMRPLQGEHYMRLTPYDYQLQGVRYALEKKRCIFGDQPGLGKTLQAICTLVKAHRESETYGETFPALVVCPAALKINWQREFEKFAGIEAVILCDKNRDNWHRSGAKVFITNYESLKKFFVKTTGKGLRVTMRSIKFDERIGLFKSVILDESHKCKSPSTQQSKFAQGICKGKEWILALTGTPVVNNNTDLIQQLKILGRLDDDFGGYYRFMERYCAGFKMSSHLKELNYRLRKCGFFRREKSAVLTQLPDKMRQYILCPLTNRDEYNDAQADLVSYLMKYRDATDQEITTALRGEMMVKLSILKEISARGKIKAVSDFIHSVVDGGEKLIMFAYLKEVVTALKEQFPGAVTVTGSDTTAQKQQAVDRFQNDPDCRLIILNYKSGGTGLTLTAASRVGFIEFPWTYSDCEQAEDRAHRNGQKNAVNCYYFLGDKTVDEYMYKVIQGKKKIADTVTGTKTQVAEEVIDMIFKTLI